MGGTVDQGNACLVPNIMNAPKARNLRTGSFAFGVAGADLIAEVRSYAAFRTASVQYCTNKKNLKHASLLNKPSPSVLFGAGQGAAVRADRNLSRPAGVACEPQETCAYNR